MSARGELSEARVYVVWAGLLLRVYVIWAGLQPRGRATAVVWQALVRAQQSTSGPAAPIYY